MSNFEYPYTCPDINRHINTFKDKMSDYVDEIIDDLSPLFARTKEAMAYREDCLREIYEFAEDCFEKTRDTNLDMRREAERQIQRLSEELEEANSKLQVAEQLVEDLESEIAELTNGEDM